MVANKLSDDDYIDIFVDSSKGIKRNLKSATALRLLHEHASQHNFPSSGFTKSDIAGLHAICCTAAMQIYLAGIPPPVTIMLMGRWWSSNNILLYLRRQQVNELFENVAKK